LFIFIQISILSKTVQSDAGNVNPPLVKQSRNRASVPQSLTLLMNFKNDGTTSFQIMQGKDCRLRQCYLEFVMYF
jgi:hypothetical protein